MNAINNNPNLIPLAIIGVLGLIAFSGAMLDIVRGGRRKEPPSEDSEDDLVDHGEDKDGINDDNVGEPKDNTSRRKDLRVPAGTMPQFGRGAKHVPIEPSVGGREPVMRIVGCLTSLTFLLVAGSLMANWWIWFVEGIFARSWPRPPIGCWIDLARVAVMGTLALLLRWVRKLDERDRGRRR